MRLPAYKKVQRKHEKVQRALKSNYLIDNWVYVSRQCLQVIGRDNIVLHCNCNYWLLSANQSLCQKQMLKAIYSPNVFGVTGLLQILLKKVFVF